MITLDEYKTLVSDLLDELPQEFFRELSGGVIVSEAAVIPDYAQERQDLYTLGFLSGCPANHPIHRLFRPDVSVCRAGGSPGTAAGCPAP